MSVPVSDVSNRSFQRLAAAGWLEDAQLAGVVKFTPKFERVVSWLQSRLTHLSPNGPSGPFQYPPVIARVTIERAKYDAAFPHLLGMVQPHIGGSGESDAVLMPAVCYGVYQELADRAIDDARQFDVSGWCYRHESTAELGRFRSFRMREFVIVSDDDTAQRWRDDWVTRGRTFFAQLGLPVTVKPASDPFFGPGSHFMRSSQLEQSLKHEFVAHMSDDDPGTAIGSANSHKDHLGERFSISYRDTGWAYSSCVAFGLDRIALALIHQHGNDPAGWPEAL
ncbi:hypothetical protein [Nonomuraea sp. NPDC052265]|uniref:hypothetical protein n=1 Tax=Nonomuraea sp. NPDC052265 TaxID=3364374 RepID=UPI0037CB0975